MGESLTVPFCFGPRHPAGGRISKPRNSETAYDGDATSAPAVLATALLSAWMLYATEAGAQPAFSKTGAGAFSNVTTSLLVNDAGGLFQTQGSVLCQAPQTGQLTSRRASACSIPRAFRSSAGLRPSSG